MSRGRTSWLTSLLLAVTLVVLTEHTAAAPQDTASFVTSSSSSSTSAHISELTTEVPSSTTPGGPSPRPVVRALHVRTDIRSRYARTLVTSRVVNPANHAQEVTFQFIIPEQAFISKFNMEVGGDVLDGVVRERAQAKQEYHHAVQQGQTAGHVATATVRDASHVRISVNLAAQAKASFNLTYEELLVRSKGRYELAINLSPGQPVNQMSVDVYIQETRNITRLQVPAFRSSNEIDLDDSPAENKDAEVTWVSGHQAHVRFAPNEEAQRALAKAAGGSEDRGLAGQFIVRYDVDRPTGAGEVLALDGYFVHFFSPAELKPLPKHVVFVLDVSGSMHGRKMEQLREAMDAILGELREGDYFNIIEFSYSVTVLDLESPANSTVLQPTEGRPTRWYPTITDQEEPPKSVSELPPQVKAFPASTEFITKARDAVRKMSAGGGTNIHDAVRASLGVVKRAVNYDGSAGELPEPLIIFLTDGEATVGETRPDRILALIKDPESRQVQEQEVPIFSLAFGQDADLSFLKRLSLRAGAFARKIYEAADAALQLRDFYRQVASPLLANVTFAYLDNQVDGSTVTKQKFSLLFSGSELVVAGKLRDSNAQLDTLQLNGEVRGEASEGATSYPLRPIISHDLLPEPGLLPPSATPSPQPGDRFLERLWAFLSIRQLLERYDAEREDETRGPQVGETTTTAAPSAAQGLKAKALELALKFSFVTPVTSLVVVKSNESSTSTTANPLGASTSTPGLSTTAPPPIALQVGGANGLDYEADYDQTFLSVQQQHRPRPVASSFSTIRGPGGGGFGGSSGVSYAQSSYPGISGASGFGAPGPQGFAAAQGGYTDLSLAAPTPHRRPVYTSARPSMPALPAPQPVSSFVEESESLDSDTIVDHHVVPVDKTSPEPQFNLTLVEASALSWLQLEPATSDQDDWRTLHIGNNSYKLLNANHSSGAVSGHVTCTPPLPLLGAWRCQPLLDCVLAEFATDSQRFLDSFKCTLGSTEFLGTCCPDPAVTTPPAAPEAPSSTTQPPQSTPAQPQAGPEGQESPAEKPQGAVSKETLSETSSR